MNKKKNKDKLTNFIIGIVIVFLIGSFLLMIINEINNPKKSINYIL